MIMNSSPATDLLVDDPERAEALMEQVIASFPRDLLPKATLHEVAEHYVRHAFPDAGPDRRANLIACIEEANEIRQGLYSGRTRAA